jgi:hypothetical protein
MYADDTLLYLRIESPEDHKKFQTDVDRMYNWCLKWKMSLNVIKCAAITFTNKIHYTLYDYRINDTPLQRVSTIRYLGEIFDSKLTFDLYYDNIRARTFRLTGFTQRQCKDLSNSSSNIIYDIRSSDS